MRGRVIESWNFLRVGENDWELVKWDFELMRVGWEFYV